MPRRAVSWLAPADHYYQWNARPTALDALEQTDAGDALRPRRPGLIGLGCMVEEIRTAKHLFAHLGIGEVIQRQQQASIRFRLGNNLPQNWPQPVLWQLA